MIISCRTTVMVVLVTCGLLLSCPVSAFVVTGTVLNQGSSPVADVNVDFINSSGENIPLLTGDFTQSDGSFSVDVPADTYTITYTPPPGSGMAGGYQADISVVADRTVPTMTLVPGYEISLQTVNSSGMPVAEINATFDNASGERVFAPGNTSDSAGNLQTIIPQSGAPYTMELKDVGGHGYANKKFINVAPGANVNYGQIIVGPASQVTGRTVRYSDSTPVSSVNVDMVDRSGLEISLKDDLSNAAGLFSLSGVSDGVYHVFIRPPNETGLARREFRKVRISKALDFGDIKLGTEHTVSGTVVNSSAAPIEGIDLNLTDEQYNQQIYLNNDNTLSDGTFSVMASDGTYTIDFRPPSTSPYAPRTLFGVAVTGSVNLGTIVLENYVTLSGTVRDFNNVPVPNADLDVIDLTVQKSVFTANDKTNAQGMYDVRLAPGTWNLKYSPPATRADLRASIYESYTITSNDSLDVTLSTAAASAKDWQLYR